MADLSDNGTTARTLRELLKEYSRPLFCDQLKTELEAIGLGASATPDVLNALYDFYTNSVDQKSDTQMELPLGDAAANGPGWSYQIQVPKSFSVNPNAVMKPNPKFKVGDRIRTVTGSRHDTGTITRVDGQWVYYTSDGGGSWVGYDTDFEYYSGDQLSFDLPYTNQGLTEQRKKEGRCPLCGELGRFDRSLSMICPTHGVYT